MKKIILSPQQHFWFSAEQIISNIRRSLPDWDVGYDFDEIRDFEYILILNDHEKWQDYLSEVSINTTLLIPIFGNLTIEIERWLKLKVELVGRKVRFICGSRRQAEQAKQFLPESLVCEIPFPIPDFYSLTNQFDTIEMVYAGRLTAQKNVIELIRSFNQVCRLFRRDLKLHIAGDFHDRGYHLHGLEIGNYKERCLDLMRANPNIVYHGHLEQEELLSLYQRTNISLSLSTYHDEDYGLSLGQALKCGHHLLISDWGGHGNYIDNFSAKGIHVEIEDRFPKINSKEFIKRLVELELPTELQLEGQKKRADAYFSKENFQENLSQLLIKDETLFDDLTPLYLKYLEIAKNKIPFHPSIEGNLYSKIYQTYLK